jgi:membrane associated rhomboid family serine protease
MQPTPPPAGGYHQDPYGQFAGCYRHPDRATGVRCVRCDRPICGECQRPAAVGFQCPDDVRAGQASVRRSRTPVGAVLSAQAPWATYALIGLNVVAYVATGLSTGGSLGDNRGSRLFDDWVLSPYQVGHHSEYYRMVTSAFTHIGPLHLIVNMIALYMLGPLLERLLGWWRFLAVYLVAALGGSVAVLLFDDRGGAGASGAIFGLFAAMLLMSRVSGFDPRPLVITVALNFIITFSVPGISKMAHIGGFVVGGVATLAILGWTLRPTAPQRRTASVQWAGLAAILAVLVGATAARAADIKSQPAIEGLGAAPAVVHSVDKVGENYSGVITVVNTSMNGEPTTVLRPT